MVIIADMHTHTIASGHAYSTVNELAQAAAARGLKAVAITDHGPALPGGPHPYHFGAMRFIPPFLHGVRVFRGVEANILGTDGHLDLPDGTLQNLEFVMAGLHEGCGLDDRGLTANTEAVINAMSNTRVKAVSHPGNPAFPVDLAALARAAAATGTALEFNNSSFSLSRKGSRPHCENLARLVAREGGPVMIGSDAHIAQGVGEFHDAIEVLTTAGIREEQVVNASLPRLLAFLGLD